MRAVRAARAAAGEERAGAGRARWARAPRQHSAELERRVAPASRQREQRLLAALLALIAAAGALRHWQLRQVGAAAAGAALAPYQRLDAALAAVPRSLHRTLLASAAEIAGLRDREGVWPEAELLAQEGLPPFAAALVPPDLRGYEWIGYERGSWVDYLGQRDPLAAGSAAAGVSVILRLIDLHAPYHPHPHPGIDYDPELDVAAQVWFHPEPARAYPGERLPEAGWLWIVAPGELASLRAAPARAAAESAP